MNITKTLYQISRQTGIAQSTLEYWANQLYDRARGSFTKDQENEIISKIKQQTTSQKAGNWESQLSGPKKPVTDFLTSEDTSILTRDRNVLDKILRRYSKLERLEQDELLDFIIQHLPEPMDEYTAKNYLPETSTWSIDELEF